MGSDTRRKVEKIQRANIRAVKGDPTAGEANRAKVSGVSPRDRLLLYRDPSVQLLITKFVRGELVELLPHFDSARTARYPEVENIVDGDPLVANQLVEKLWDTRILKRAFLEKTLACPNCHSANVSCDYACPNCNSIEIVRRTLIEHTSCGTTDNADNFIVEGSFFCPSCKKELVEAGVDYQSTGVMFECAQCGKRSELPSPAHRCRSCGHSFTIREAGFVSIYSYRLSTDAEEEFKRTRIVTRPVARVLEKFHYTVEMPGQIAGKSGVLHRFDAVASQGSTDVVFLDIAVGDKQLDEVPVTSFYAKIFDVAPCRTVLIAIPSLTERARKLACLYRITVIEASSSQGAAEHLKERLA